MLVWYTYDGSIDLLGASCGRHMQHSCQRYTSVPPVSFLFGCKILHKPYTHTYQQNTHTCPGAAPSTRPPCRPSRIHAQNVNAAADIGGDDLHKNPPEPPEYSEIWCEMCRNAAGTSSCAIQYSSRCTTTASRGSAAPSRTLPSRSAFHVSHDQHEPAARAAVALLLSSVLRKPAGGVPTRLGTH